MTEDSDELVRFGGELVQKKLAKAKLGALPSETVEKIVRELDQDEYQNQKQLSKKLKLTCSAIGYGVREAVRNEFIWRVDGKKRKSRLGLTVKGDALAKKLTQENPEYSGRCDLKAEGWTVMKSTKQTTLLLKGRVKVESAMLSDHHLGLEYRIVLALMIEKNSPRGIAFVVKAKQVAVEARLPTLQALGFVQCESSGKHELYEPTRDGETLATSVTMSFQCESCGKLTIPTYWKDREKELGQHLSPVEYGFPSLVDLCNNCLENAGETPTF